MTREDPIQQALARVGTLVTPAPSFEDEVMRRIGRLPGRAGRTRRILMKSTIAVAACALIAVAAWVVLGTATPSLYAQAVKAIEQARTVHIVGKQLQDGKMVKSMEAFYERGVGVAEYTYDEERPFFRVDNGKSCWRRSGNGPVVQSKSSDPLGIAKKAFRNATKALEAEKNATRRPAGDRAIDGARCKQYVLLWSQGRLRTLIWIDGQDRMRRFDKQRPKGDDWETYRTVTVEYDVPIDRSHFHVEIPPAATVVDAEKVLAGFSPEKALLTRELMGSIFAVHELQRCDNGMIFIVCSTRPTASVLREFGPIRSATMGSVVYGDFQLDSSWKRVEGKERYYQPIHIANFRHDGMELKWMLLHPLGDWPQPMETCELSVYVYARGKLQEKYSQAGQDWYKRFKPLAVLPLPGQAVPFGEVIGKVHAEAIAAEPLDGQAAVLEASRQGKDGRWSRRYRKPSEMPPERFAEEVRRELEHLEQRRRERTQPKAGGRKPGG